MSRRLILLLAALLLTIAVAVPALAQETYACGDLSADAHDEAGERFRADAQYLLAVEAYTCALALDPRDAYYHNERGRNYDDAGLYNEAINDFTLALEYDTNDEAHIFLTNRAYSYIALRDYNIALADAAAAIEANPDYGNAYIAQGNAHYYLYDYEAAIASYQETVNINDRDSNVGVAHFNSGLANYELGRYEAAAERYRQAIETYPSFERSYLSLGNAYAALNDERAHVFFYQWLQRIETERVEFENRQPNDETFSIERGRVFYFRFPVTQGQRIVAQATDRIMDPMLLLLNENGTPIASDDDSGVSLDAVMTLEEAPSSGTYTLVMGHAYDSDASDNLTLSLSVDGSIAVGFQTYALEIGNPVRVFTTGGDSLNLRAGTSTESDILTKLENGTVVTLLEGPRKEEGYAWWKVRLADGSEGWAVERADEEQTLKPLMEVGGQALVFTTDRLNVRAEASTSAEIVTQLQPGAVVDIIGGPVTDDQYTWWQVRAAGGSEGWAVERIPDEDTLVGKPAPRMD